MPVSKWTMYGLFSFLCFSACSQIPAPVSPGKQINLVTTSAYTMTQDMGGQEIVISSTNIFTSSVKINRENPIIHISYAIKRMQMTGQAMNRKTDFDSDKKEDMNGEMGAPFKNIINKDVEIDISATDGRLVKNDLPQPADMFAALALQEYQDALVNELFLFAKDYKLDDTFRVESGEADSKRSIIYTVKQISDTSAMLDFSGTEISRKERSAAGMVVTTSTENNLSGNMVVDIKTGVIRRKKTDINSKGTTQTMNRTVLFTMKKTVTSSTG